MTALGVTVAVAMLAKSLNPGRYAEYMQFETLRKLRSAYSNVYHASAQGSTLMMTLGRDTSKSFLSNCPTHSLWFERFVKGCFHRMGQETHQDLALSIGVILELLNILEAEWNAPDASREELAYVGSFICITYAGSFRGNEVFHTDLYGLLKYLELPLIEAGQRYVLIPLLGRFKNKDGERYHLIPVAYESASGIKIGCWVERLADIKRKHRQMRGPAFSDQRSEPLSSLWIEMEILDRLNRIQAEKQELIPKEENVDEEYGISRSFMRGATTQARNKKVDENDINLVNRWRTVEAEKRVKPRLRMQDHYSEIVPSLLRLSQAL
jgi:hypothetical protein